MPANVFCEDRDNPITPICHCVVWISLVQCSQTLSSDWQFNHEITRCLSLLTNFMDFIIIIIHFSAHPLGNICTSDSEAGSLLVILKIILRGTVQDLFVLKHIYNLLVDHGFAVFYSCTVQKCYNPSFDLDLEFLSTIKLSGEKKPKKKSQL